MTHQTIPPSAIPLQAFAAPAYVYLLASATEPSVCKLGITSRLAARLDSLHISDGAFNLERSVIVAAQSRRAAFDLETVLRTIFAAPRWRAISKTQRTKPSGCRHYNGSSEWYDARAFTPMVTFVVELITHDTASGINRYHLENDGYQLAAWYGKARRERRHRQPAQRSYEIDQANRLADSEANFARVQAWIAARNEQLIEVRPMASVDGGTVGSIFVFRATLGSLPSRHDDPSQECEELVSHCRVSYRQGRSWGAVSYLGGIETNRELSTYSVELTVTPHLDEIAAHDPRLADLVARIKAWLVAPHRCHVED